MIKKILKFITSDDSQSTENATQTIVTPANSVIEKIINSSSLSLFNRDLHPIGRCCYKKDDKLCNKKAMEICCKKCRVAYYCSQEHRKKDELCHKSICKIIQFINFLKCPSSGTIFANSYKNCSYSIHKYLSIFFSSIEAKSKLGALVKLLGKTPNLDRLPLQYEVFSLQSGCYRTQHETPEKEVQFFQRLAYMGKLLELPRRELFFKIDSMVPLKQIMDVYLSRNNLDPESHHGLILKYNNAVIEQNQLAGECGLRDGGTISVTTLESEKESAIKPLLASPNAKKYLAILRKHHYKKLAKISSKLRNESESINPKNISSINNSSLNRETENIENKFSPRKIKYINMNKHKSGFFYYDQFRFKNKNCCVDKCYRNTDLFCDHCKTAFYCSREHQIEDWPFHKIICPFLHFLNSIRCQISGIIMKYPVHCENACSHGFELEEILKVFGNKESIVCPVKNCDSMLHKRNLKIYERKRDDINTLVNQIERKFYRGTLLQKVNQSLLNHTLYTQIISRDSHLSHYINPCKRSKKIKYIVKYTGSNPHLIKNRETVIFYEPNANPTVFEILKRYYKWHELNLKKIKEGYLKEVIDTLDMDITSEDLIIKMFFNCTYNNSHISLGKTSKEIGLYDGRKIFVDFIQDRLSCSNLRYKITSLILIARRREQKIRMKEKEKLLNEIIEMIGAYNKLSVGDDKFSENLINLLKVWNSKDDSRNLCFNMPKVRNFIKRYSEQLSVKFSYNIYSLIDAPSIDKQNINNTKENDINDPNNNSQARLLNKYLCCL